MSEPTRVRVVVHGRVQGVFFRDTVRRAARERGVAGSVRNLPTAPSRRCSRASGTTWQALVELCREGPPGAPWSAWR